MTTNPEPTPQDAALLAELLAGRGVELRVTPSGELQLRDRDKRLSPADRATVHHYADALADWLAEPATPNGESATSVVGGTTNPPPTHVEGSPKAPSCDRCRHAEFREVPIHDGQSIRRDCARCGRTWGFPVWYGDTG